jgi:hypothetical protein
MHYLGNIIDRPDTFAAFIAGNGYGIAACLMVAYAAAFIVQNWEV